MGAKIRLFIAQSLDGKIARNDNSIDWLDKVPNPEESDFGYNDFIKDIGIILMGRKTYEEVLGFGVEWPYPDQECVIISRSDGYEAKTPKTSFHQGIDPNWVQDLRSSGKGDIWVVGGGELIATFLEMEEIDEMIISTIPVILGEGLPLFPDHNKESWFDLIGIENLGNGIFNMEYRRKA